ncbi:MAG: SIR2 family protein [Anaerolineae bacterium]|nr:SIR2 family protein [Anaerolineae bacterium]
MEGRRAARLRRQRNREDVQDSFWQDFVLRIKNGEVIPIISNSVRNDRIFDIDYDYNVGISQEKIDLHAAVLNIQEELAEEWAAEIKYPLPDKQHLARVAVYNRIISLDDAQAKRRYLNFLKTYLLDLAEEDEMMQDLVPGLRAELGTLSFSDIAFQLDYPRFTDAYEDPLRLLAQLPLPIYITTSHHDFLERALHAEKKTPRTQICFLFGEPMNIMPEHRADPDFIPTPQSPLVYHLHGFEQYPESLIISEDDYLNFLVRVLDERREVNAPLIPLLLSEALSSSSIILLGYRLHDWDFRVVFRGLIKTKPGSLRKYSLAIQLDPVERRLAMANLDDFFAAALAAQLDPDEQSELPDDHAMREYLKEYFKPEKFIVEWGTTCGFIRKMCNKWDEWRRGQE